jgi:hypothetical protein
VATAEQIYLHVSAGRAAAMDAGVRASLARVHAAQAHLPLPPQAGRVGGARH